MKKRLNLIMVVMMVALMMVACEKTEEVSDISPNVQEQTEEDAVSTNEEKERDSKSPAETILGTIEADFATTVEKMQDELENTQNEIGGTYDDYVNNKALLDEWYTLVLEESAALFERTKSNTEKFYKEIAETKDEKYIEESLDEYYDEIYEDAMDNFYDSIYEEARDQVYEMYYEGILEEGRDNVDYEEWLDERSECYGNWLDFGSDLYGLWLDTRSDYYGLWLDVKSELWRGNYDLGEIFKENEHDNKNTDMEENSGESKEEEKVEESDVGEISETEEGKSETDDLQDVIDPDFKAAMDSYEKFFDEYVDFMKKYMNAGPEDVMAMMGDYADYLEQYTETMKKLEELEEEDMTAAEAAYYAEVTGRITQKLLEVQ